MKHKLGRTTDKPGRKGVSTLSDEQRAAIREFGKYARFNGCIVETADYADCIDLLTRI